MKLRCEWFCSEEIKATYGEIFDLDSLADFFDDVFHLFVEDANGRMLKDVIDQDWQLFAGGCNAQDVLNNAADLCGSTFRHETRVRYSDEVMVAVNNWLEIKNELQGNRRFLMDDFIRQKDENWKWIFTNNDHLHIGDCFFRGRINTEKDKPYVEEKDMSAPPADKATSGRANPYGIPHLYLTDSPETAMYELRAVTGDQLTIAKFEITEELDIIDFTKHEDLYNMYNGEYDSLLQAVQRWALFREVSRDMSRPVRRYDNANLDYLPTQLVCEYIRVVKHMDGLIYQSSRNGIGRKNIVLFDKFKAHMITKELKMVGEVEMHFEDDDIVVR